MGNKQLFNFAAKFHSEFVIHKIAMTDPNWRTDVKKLARKKLVRLNF